MFCKHSHVCLVLADKFTYNLSAACSLLCLLQFECLKKKITINRIFIVVNEVPFLKVGFNNSSSNACSEVYIIIKDTGQSLALVSQRKQIQFQLNEHWIFWQWLLLNSSIQKNTNGCLCFLCIFIAKNLCWTSEKLCHLLCWSEFAFNLTLGVSVYSAYE